MLNSGSCRLLLLVAALAQHFWALCHILEYCLVFCFLQSFGDRLVTLVCFGSGLVQCVGALSSILVFLPPNSYLLPTNFPPSPPRIAPSPPGPTAAAIIRVTACGFGNKLESLICSSLIELKGLISKMVQIIFHIYRSFYIYTHIHIGICIYIYIYICIFMCIIYV